MIERRDGFSHRQPEHIFSNYSSYRQRLLVLQYEQHMSVIKVWVKANGSCVQVTHVTYMNKDCLCPHIVFLQTSLMGIFYSSEWINYQIIKHLTKCGAFIWQSPILRAICTALALIKRCREQMRIFDTLQVSASLSYCRENLLVLTRWGTIQEVDTLHHPTGAAWSVQERVRLSYIQVIWIRLDGVGQRRWLDNS